MKSEIHDTSSGHDSVHLKELRASIGLSENVTFGQNHCITKMLLRPRPYPVSGDMPIVGT